MLKIRIILQLIETKTVFKMSIKIFNLVIESLQAILTDVRAGNAPTGNASHDPRWCWKTLYISSLFASLSLVVGLNYKFIKV